MAGATLIQSRNFSEPANPQKYLDGVSHINNFYEIKEEMTEKLTKMMIFRFGLQERHASEIKEKIKEQQFWKNTQAWFSKGFLGGASGLAMILAGIVDATAANVFKGISQLTSSTGDVSYYAAAAQEISPQTQLQQLLNTESLDRQSQQTLRELSNKLEDIIKQIIRNEIQLFGSVRLQ